MTLDGLLSVALLLALAAPIGLAAAWFTNQGPGALAGFFRADPGLGWPRGVQEDDDVTWNWSPGSAAAAAFAQASAEETGDTVDLSPRPGGAPPRVRAHDAGRAATTSAYEVESTKVSPRPVHRRR